MDIKVKTTWYDMFKVPSVVTKVTDDEIHVETEGVPYHMSREHFLEHFTAKDDIEYVFTFGFGQVYQNGYHVIEADSSEQARHIMHEKFGSKWSMQYDAPNAREKAGVNKFNLKEIK